MPTYDYRCRDCGHTLELIHGMTEDGPAVCEVCGGPMRRVMFATGIIFKGSGFYRNDSRSDAGSGGTKTTTPASTSTDGSAPASSSSGADAGSSSTSGSETIAPKPSAAAD